MEKKEMSPDSPLKMRRRRASWSPADIWRLTNNNKNKPMTPPSPLKDVVFAMHLHHHSLTPTKTKPLIRDFSKVDKTLLLSDDILLKILKKLPESNVSSLVCKRWLNLHGRLLRSLKVTDWKFLESGRLVSRFPNLSNVDLVRGCLVSPRNSGVLVSHRLVWSKVDPKFCPNWPMIDDNLLLSVEMVDRGLRTVASGCPNLRRLVVMNASELGLLYVADECSTLQELELYKCSDSVLRGIAACENLQILRLVGSLDGFYDSLVSDVGLTILAQGCRRLVKLELIGCEGSFDGIKALGQCCQMLEELTVCDHRMEGGWFAGLRYCENLKTLKIVSCKSIDTSPGLDEYLGSCPALEQLHLQKCQLRDKKSAGALFKICEAVRELVFQDCWGLEDDIFSLASSFRRVKLLSLEGCSLLTTTGLESVILQWQELEHLKVVSCKNIKTTEISPALSTLFSALVELQWRPDTRTHLASSLIGTGIGRRGGKFFKKT